MTSLLSFHPALEVLVFSLVKLPSLLPGMPTADNILMVLSSTNKDHPLLLVESPDSLERIFTGQHFDKKSQLCLKSEISPELEVIVQKHRASEREPRVPPRPGEL